MQNHIPYVPSLYDQLSPVFGATPSPSMELVPMVVEKTPNGERSFDIFSRLLKDRIVMVKGEVNSVMANIIKAQILYLESEDSTKPIWLYIDSPGGCVHSGLGIRDIMDLVECPIYTLCVGMAASMGYYLLNAGDKRFITRFSQIMAHKVSAGNRGHIEDMRRSFEHSDRLNELLGNHLAEAADMPIEEYMQIVDRDLWLNAEEALVLGNRGAVDGIIQKGFRQYKDKNGILVDIN